MHNSPCERCEKERECQVGKLCPKWQIWFLREWRRAQLQLGVMPPEEGRSGRPVKYIYEVRKERSGEVVCRGTAADVAQLTGLGEKTVRTAAAGVVKGMYRITKLEVGEEQPNAEHETGENDAGRDI